MTAKEPKAVAWLMTCEAYRRPPEVYLSEPGFVPPISKLIPLIPESALHAAEAELGELRRRVGVVAGHLLNEANGWSDDMPTAAFADFKDIANELRQLLAADGGADGDNTNEELK